MPGGGSVATSAFSLSLKWGCDPIVFVGLDLSFPDGKYYVSTSSDGEARARIDGNGIVRFHFRGPITEKDVRDTLAKQGVTVKLSTPEELDRRNRADYEHFVKLIKDAKIKGD